MQHFREGKARPYRTPVPVNAHQTHVTTAPQHKLPTLPCTHHKYEVMARVAFFFLLVKFFYYSLEAHSEAIMLIDMPDFTIKF